jgi:hypothetical protein
MLRKNKFGQPPVSLMIVVAVIVVVLTIVYFIFRKSSPSGTPSPPPPPPPPSPLPGNCTMENYLKKFTTSALKNGDVIGTYNLPGLIAKDTTPGATGNWVLILIQSNPYTQWYNYAGNIAICNTNDLCKLNNFPVNDNVPYWKWISKSIDPNKNNNSYNFLFNENSLGIYPIGSTNPVWKCDFSTTAYRLELTGQGTLFASNGDNVIWSSESNEVSKSVVESISPYYGGVGWIPNTLINGNYSFTLNDDGTWVYMNNGTQKTGTIFPKGHVGTGPYRMILYDNKLHKIASGPGIYIVDTYNALVNYVNINPSQGWLPIYAGINNYCFWASNNTNGDSSPYHFP